MTSFLKLYFTRCFIVVKRTMERFLVYSLSQRSEAIALLAIGTIFYLPVLHRTFLCSILILLHDFKSSISSVEWCFFSRYSVEKHIPKSRYKFWRNVLKRAKGHKFNGGRISDLNNRKFRSAAKFI